METKDGLFQDDEKDPFLRVSKILDYVVKEMTELIMDLKRCSEQKIKIEEKSALLRLERQIFKKEKKLICDLTERGEKIMLNVGGKKLTTTRSTLRSIPGTVVDVMFSGRHRLAKDSNGSYFLDRDAKYFKHVLNYLRDGKLRIPSEKDNEILRNAILDEFDYFCIPLPEERRDFDLPILDYKHIVNVKTITHHYVAPWMIKFSGKRIITCGQPEDNKYGVNILDMISGKIHAEFLQNRIVYSVFPFGNILVAGGFRHIWTIDLNSRNVTKIRRAHDNAIRCVSVQDGKIVSVSLDRSIKVWNLETGILLQHMVGHADGVYCMDVLGDILLTGSRDNTIKIWSLHTGTCTATLYGHQDVVRGVRVFHDFMVSCSDDGSVKVWCPGTGKCVRTLEGHTDSVYCIDVHGKVVTSASCDYKVKIWDLETGVCRFTLEGHSDWVDSVARTDNLVVSLSQDRTIRFWKGINID